VATTAAAAASASAARIRLVWLGPLGAVRPLERPSLLTALPASTARGGGAPPVGRQPASNGSSTATAKPSPRPYPSASAPKLLHRPSADKARTWVMAAVAPKGAKMALAPAAAAKGALSPRAAERAARCVATSDEEHAVLVGTQGPVSPSAYESLPAMNASPLPVTACALRPCSASASPYSADQMQPRKTPPEQPATERGARPEATKAATASSSSTRPWGSIKRASRRGSAKTAASKVCTPGTKVPKRVETLVVVEEEGEEEEDGDGAWWSGARGSYAASGSQRARGKARCSSGPPTRSLSCSSASDDAPATRTDRAVMAIRGEEEEEGAAVGSINDGGGSDGRAPAAATLPPSSAARSASPSSWYPAPSASARCTYPAIASIVG